MALEFHGSSDIGLARLDNEDVFACLPEAQFFVLADGMGGHNAGEVAAQITVDSLCTYVRKVAHERKSPKAWSKLLREAICDTNLHVYRMGESNAEQQGMGTTLCLCLITENQMIIGHVGDSRIYRFRKRRLTRLTQDHSLKGQLIAQGVLDEESARDFPRKNVITRAIGTQTSVEPELSILDIEPDDLYILCSDGLTDPLSDEEISDILRQNGAVKHITERLILAAKEAGGDDNITVMTLRVNNHTNGEK